MFWCRQWGYSDVNCVQLTSTLQNIECKKMIISHCPQFLDPCEPKMINFDCLIESSLDKYMLARIDLGMSRAFEYNLPDKFDNCLINNFNRKISVLKLQFVGNELFFNNNSIITSKLSCIQYLLLKYGFTKQEWESQNIKTDWYGFNYVNHIFEKIINKEEIMSEVCNHKINPMLCLLYSLLINKNNIKSINEYKYLTSLQQ